MRDPGYELRRTSLLRLSEKGKRSLPCSLTEHQNGTFRPIFASQHVQIRTHSVVRTPFRTVSPRTRVNRGQVNRIVAKLQTQGYSSFVLYSPRAASTD